MEIDYTKFIPLVATKECSKCKKDKDVNEFGYDETHQDNRKNICKGCIKEYNQSRRERANELRRNVSEKEKNKRREQQKEWLNNNPEKAILKQVKNRATRKGIEFNLDLSDIIIPTHCPLLGIELERGTKGNYQNSPSLDRKDPTKGYIKGNVRIISCKANTMKSNANIQELLHFTNNLKEYINNEDIV